MRPQVEVLEDEAQFAAHPVDLPGVGGDQIAVLGLFQLEFFTGDEDLALVRVFQQVDAAQEGGLAGTGGAEDGDDIAVAGGKGNALEHFEVTVTLVQVTDFQGGYSLSHAGLLCFVLGCF
ncbi:hypothetical protein D3C78_664140 [compost metagenome]